MNTNKNKEQDLNKDIVNEEEIKKRIESITNRYVQNYNKEEPPRYSSPNIDAKRKTLLHKNSPLIPKLRKPAPFDFELMR